jgi:hypothetical protein
MENQTGFRFLRVLPLGPSVERLNQSRDPFCISLPVLIICDDQRQNSHLQAMERWGIVI